jgi:hypothetical protein
MLRMNCRRSIATVQVALRDLDLLMLSLLRAALLNASRSDPFLPSAPPGRGFGNPETKKRCATKAPRRTRALSDCAGSVADCPVSGGELSNRRWPDELLNSRNHANRRKVKICFSYQ